MMGAVHNSVYLRWFEEGRLHLLQDIIRFEEALSLGIAFIVIENHCHYKRPARFGDDLLLITRHRLKSDFEAKIRFDHSLVHKKTKVEMAYGETVITAINPKTFKLATTIPTVIQTRYKNLA